MQIAMEIYLPTLTTLLLAHVIGDFPLQTNRIFRWKMQSNAGILAHVVIHLIITFFLLENPVEVWSMLVWLGLIHFAIDWLKLRLPPRPQTPGFIFDQAAHILSLLFLAMQYPFLQPRLPMWLIYPALIYSLAPVIIMLVWVLMGDLAAKQPDFSYKHLQPKLLRWSQQAGWVLIGAVLLVGVVLFLSAMVWNVEPDMVFNN